VPLALRARKLISERQLLLNAKKKFKNPEDVPQVIYDQLRKVEKRLNKLRARKDHLVEDLHKRVAYDLLVENDIILLPTFNTSKMVKKGFRKIGRNTVAAMLDLNHYRFKLHLRWLAKKYGKVVIDVNEAYTSKTYNGRIMNNLGGKSSFKVPLVDGRSKVIGRDLNGARNILIRFVTTHT
jgi:putative transposase